MIGQHRSLYTSYSVGVAEPGSTAGGDRYRETTGRLIVEIGQRLRTRVGPAFGSAGLKPRQVDLLRVLARQESTSQQQLVEALKVDPSVLVGLLNELERDDSIQRIRDPQDRRRHLVEISDLGLARLDGMLSHIERAEEAVFAVLSEQERESLWQLLAAVRNGMDRASGPCPPQDT